jgi:hypothetical protein
MAWVAWAWPVMTFVAITAFLFVLFGVGSRPVPAPSAPAAPLEPAVHLNTRQWRAVADDPLAHAGERILLWGQVTQLDATTGPSSFRAKVDAAHHIPTDGVVNYPTDVIMHGDPAEIRKAVPGYIFKAEVTVDPAPAGRAPSARPSVPTLTVTKLTITDKTVG